MSTCKSSFVYKFWILKMNIFVPEDLGMGVMAHVVCVYEQEPFEWCPLSFPGHVPSLQLRNGQTRDWTEFHLSCSQQQSQGWCALGTLGVPGDWTPQLWNDSEPAEMGLECVSVMNTMCFLQSLHSCSHDLENGVKSAQVDNIAPQSCNRLL